SGRSAVQFVKVRTRTAATTHTTIRSSVPPTAHSAINIAGYRWPSGCSNARYSPMTKMPSRTTAETQPAPSSMSVADRSVHRVASTPLATCTIIDQIGGCPAHTLDGLDRTKSTVSLYSAVALYSGSTSSEAAVLI